MASLISLSAAEIEQAFSQLGAVCVSPLMFWKLWFSFLSCAFFLLFVQVYLVCVGGCVCGCGCVYLETSKLWPLKKKILYILPVDEKKFLILI